MLRGVVVLLKDEVSSLIPVLNDSVLKDRLKLISDTGSNEVSFELNEEDIENILDLEIGDELRKKLSELLNSWR